MRRILEKYIFVCFILIGVYVILFSVENKNKNIIVLLTFAINFIISIFNLSRSYKLGYNLADMFWIFNLTFFVVAPIIQYMEGIFPWGGSASDEIIILANIIIMIFSLVFILSNKVIYKRKKENIKLYELKNFKQINNILFIFSSIIFLYIIFKTGFGNLFARSTNQIEGINGSISLIINNSLRIIPITGIALNLIYWRKNKKIYNKMIFIAIALMGVIINFPTSMARFKMATIYIGILILVKKQFKNKYIFKIIVIVGLLFIFPLINIFRNNSFAEISNLTINLPNPTEDFLRGDFDSYVMLIRSIEYILICGSSLGYQLMGNIFFFIPRFIWTTKPIGSGATIAENLNWEFTNVSCPYVGEGIINFNIVGVVMFALILSIFIKKVTESHMVSVENSNGITFIELIYPFLFGFLFFILRGDLMSSVSYLIGFTIPFKGIFVLDKMFNKMR